MYSIEKLKSVLKEREIPLEEKVRILTEVNNTGLCPYEGHPINLRKLPDSHIRPEELRCLVCDEWIMFKNVDNNIIVRPYPKDHPGLRHPDKYKCIVEDPNKWYDQDLNEVIESKNGIPLEKFHQNLIPLGNGYYAVLREKL